MNVMTTRGIKGRKNSRSHQHRNFPLPTTWLMFNVIAVFQIEFSWKFSLSFSKCSSEDAFLEMRKHVKFFDIFIPHWLKASSTVCLRLYFYVSLETCFNFQRLHVKKKPMNLFCLLNIFFSMSKHIWSVKHFRGKIARTENGFLKEICLVETFFEIQFENFAC